MKENIIYDLLYPQNITCICCNEDVFSDDKRCICPKCDKTLPKIEGKICFRCGQIVKTIDKYCDMCKKPKPYYMARACFEYTGKIIALIRNLKFHNAQYLAENLAACLFETYKKEKFKCDIIVPVPMREERLKKRGYNQAGLLAYHLGKMLNVPVEEKHLYKARETLNQVGLDYKTRRNNLTDAFKTTDKTFFKGKDVLIVDDVFTTGATIESCASALKKGKARKIYAITVAHTKPKLD